MTEAEARNRGRDAGYRSMKRGKRKAWNGDDAAAALVEYRCLVGHPNISLEAAKAALAGLTGGAGSSNHKRRLSNRSSTK